MNQTISKQFHAALIHLLAKEGRGAQSRLAREQNIDRGYMNAIAKGRKSGAEDIRTKIAVHFGMAYEDMLALGRTILDGEDSPGSGKSGRIDGGETARSEATMPEKGISELGEPQKSEEPRLSISEKMMKVVAILESDSKYRDTLSGLIDAFYEAVNAKKENQTLRNQMKEMESRIADLELLAYEKDEVRKSA